MKRTFNLGKNLAAGFGVRCSVDRDCQLCSEAKAYAHRFSSAQLLDSDFVFGADHTPPSISALAGGAALIAHHFRSVVFKGEPRDGSLVIALLMPMTTLLSSLMFWWIAHSTPVTYDALLANWDHGISRAVRSWTVTRPWASGPLLLTYEALPTVYLLIILFTRGYKRSRLILSGLLGGILVMPCYLLFPAVGPAHVSDPSAPRNCVPSMHLTAALFFWINTEKWVRWCAAIFAALTAVATLATGEHYVFDLVAAVPWTWLLTWLSGLVVTRFDPKPKN